MSFKNTTIDVQFQVKLWAIEWKQFSWPAVSVTFAFCDYFLIFFSFIFHSRFSQFLTFYWHILVVASFGIFFWRAYVIMQTRNKKKYEIKTEENQISAVVLTENVRMSAQKQVNFRVPEKYVYYIKKIVKLNETRFPSLLYTLILF